MKAFAATLLFDLFIGVALSVQAQPTKTGAVVGPTYYATLYGVVGDDTSDACSALTTMGTGLLDVVSAAGGGYIDLPYGGLTKLKTCNLSIPSNVVLRCYPTGPGWNTPTATPACGLHITYSANTDPAIQCLKEGQCGLENVYVQVDTDSKPYMEYTCGVPWLVNVRFKGKISAVGTDCADGVPGTCPTNKGILFGTAGQTGTMCGTLSAGYLGYGGANNITGLYFQNTSTWLEFNENANGIIVNSARGDFSDANPAGYAIVGNATMTSTYGNQFYGIGVEQAPFTHDSTECNYAGVFGLTGNAQGWYGIYASSDITNSGCMHSAKLSATSQHNHLVAAVGQFSGGAFDDSSNHMNYLEDLPNQTYSVRQLLPLYLGNGDTFNNRVLNATWAPYIVNDGGTSGGLNHITPGPYSYQTAWVSDSMTGDCATGGGAPGIKVLCFYDGTNWAPMGNGSSPTFGSPNIGTATALSLAVSGNLDGKRLVFRDTTGTVAVGTNLQEDHFNQNAISGTPVSYNLPLAAAGRRYCFTNSNNGTSKNTGALTVNASGSNVIIWTDGTNGTGGGNVHSTSTTGGESICLEGLDTGHWQVVGPPVGGWART